jgi:autotransporter-associated beta strand protein
VISGAGQLIKAGAGTLTLSANNTYTGQTTINAGQLIVNGQQSNSAVMVNSGALLGGTGRVGALSGGGTISPGTSPGVLSSGNVVFSSNTTFRVELNGTTAGTGYDQLNVGGTVTLAGTLNASLGFTPAISNSFTIIDNNANDAIVGTFAGLPEGSFIVIGGVSLQVSYLAGPGGNNVTLTSVATTAPTISSVSFLPDGTVQVLGLGQSGLTYVLESAAAIASPTIWTPVGSNTATAGGAFQFIDSSALTNPASFYRVRWP